MWCCGLATPELRLARVAARVAAGGHDIPAAQIRERWLRSPLNLINLMPQFNELRVFDNSAQAAPGQVVADPLLMLHVAQGAVQFPSSLADLQGVPAWARPTLQAARQAQPR